MVCKYSVRKMNEKKAKKEEIIDRRVRKKERERERERKHAPKRRSIQIVRLRLRETDIHTDRQTDRQTDRERRRGRQSYIDRVPFFQPKLKAYFSQTT